MNVNRKRLREDELCDLPLSKRINNLHIASSTYVQPSIQVKAVNQHVCSPALAEKRPSYDPGVHCTQSNYFYNNKLLFELHLDRLQRACQQYPW